MSYIKDMYPNEYEYLQLLNTMEGTPGLSAMYGLDAMRVNLHKKILTNLGYNCDDVDVYLRSKEIFSRLHEVINFEPCGHIADSAHELHRLLSCQECYYFLTGKTNLLRTKYGYTIRLENSNEQV